ncbi:MAG: hypothetical protein IPJ14_15210 [Kineosporiaceae bacterium]|nr:hypothetical protein [Kineosporiaceae bacterium]
MPYPSEHEKSVTASAPADPRIRMSGGVWDQHLLDMLYAHTASYPYDHSVGGTNPSLLRAMGAGERPAAFDVGFNRTVLGGPGATFADAAQPTPLIEGSRTGRRSRPVAR